MAPKQTFESALKKLENIVHEMESGDLPLEKAISKFEEGMQLSKYCSELLDKSEQRIKVLMPDASGTISEHPYGSDPDGPDES